MGAAVAFGAGGKLKLELKLINSEFKLLGQRNGGRIGTVFVPNRPPFDCSGGECKKDLK